MVIVRARRIPLRGSVPPRPCVNFPGFSIDRYEQNPADPSFAQVWRAQNSRPARKNTMGEVEVTEDEEFGSEITVSGRRMQHLAVQFMELVQEDKVCDEWLQHHFNTIQASMPTFPSQLEIVK